MLEDLMSDLLSRAGVAPGMRVRDVGCGVGDASLLAARIVGDKGSVLGVDRSASPLEIARGRAKRRAALCETATISFVEADLNTFDRMGLSTRSLADSCCFMCPSEQACCVV